MFPSVEKDVLHLTRSYRFDQHVAQLADTSIRPNGVHKMKYLAAFLRVSLGLTAGLLGVLDALPWFHEIRRRSGDRSLAA